MVHPEPICIMISKWLTPIRNTTDGGVSADSNGNSGDSRNASRMRRAATFLRQLDPIQPRRWAVFRTLRFRLASTFLLLLTFVLIVVGIVGTTTLRNLLDNQSNQALHDEFNTLMGYLHIDSVKEEPYWFADTSDPEERATVDHLKEISIIANEDGQLWEAPTDSTFEDLYKRSNIRAEVAQMRATGEPYIKTIVGKDGQPYEVMSALRVDDRHHYWYVSLWHSLKANRDIYRKFRLNYLLFFPIALVVCMAVSWYSAGKALSALQSVQKAAQNITGSNLGLQIPRRGADDELDRLIGSFNEMSGRLKASFEQIRRFSTDVSHELRTPLTAIQGQLEVALFTATKPEQLREAIENALQDVERLSNLVRALLLLSQSESGQIPMNRTVLELNCLVHEIVDQFQIPAEAHNLTLTQETTAPVLCEADQMQIERVVTNLLSNAIKYTPPGGWIKTRVESAGDHVRLIVEDSGVGIPPDHLPHIFDRFYRVPDPNPEKGLGLGLSFVAAIVKAHDGEIRVESELGKGSRFEILLPAGSAVAAIYEQPTLQG
ncbi:MAG TPA: ATP-binding protein [Bryobacteraceae bacterium]|nr:ATP-binding protein [Bryobacteraceae bacterium]